MSATNAKLEALKNYCELHSLDLREDVFAGGYVVCKRPPSGYIDSIWLAQEASLESWIEMLGAEYG